MVKFGKFLPDKDWHTAHRCNVCILPVLFSLMACEVYAVIEHEVLCFNGFILKYMNYISTLRQSYILCSEIYFISARGVSRGGGSVHLDLTDKETMDKRNKFGMQDRIFRTNVNPGLLSGPFPWLLTIN